MLYQRIQPTDTEQNKVITLINLVRPSLRKYLRNTHIVDFSDLLQKSIELEKDEDEERRVSARKYSRENKVKNVQPSDSSTPPKCYYCPAFHFHRDCEVLKSRREEGKFDTNEITPTDSRSPLPLTTSSRPVSEVTTATSDPRSLIIVPQRSPSNHHYLTRLFSQVDRCKARSNTLPRTTATADSISCYGSITKGRNNDERSYADEVTLRHSRITGKKSYHTHERTNDLSRKRDSTRPPTAISSKSMDMRSPNSTYSENKTPTKCSKDDERLSSDELYKHRSQTEKNDEKNKCDQEFDNRKIETSNDTNERINEHLVMKNSAGLSSFKAVFDCGQNIYIYVQVSKILCLYIQPASYWRYDCSKSYRYRNAKQVKSYTVFVVHVKPTYTRSTCERRTYKNVTFRPVRRLFPRAVPRAAQNLTRRESDIYAGPTPPTAQITFFWKIVAAEKVSTSVERFRRYETILKLKGLLLYIETRGSEDRAQGCHVVLTSRVCAVAPTRNWLFEWNAGVWSEGRRSIRGRAPGVGSIPTRRIFEVRFFAWCGRACARGGAGTTQKEDPGYVISLRSGKKPRSLCELKAKRITISRSPRRGLTRLAIDGAQHSQDDVRSENHTHKRALDAGAKAQQERMMAPEARTTLTRRQQKGVSTTHGDSQGSAGSENHTHKICSSTTTSETVSANWHLAGCDRCPCEDHAQLWRARSSRRKLYAHVVDSNTPVRKPTVWKQQLDTNASLHTTGGESAHTTSLPACDREALANACRLRGHICPCGIPPGSSRGTRRETSERRSTADRLRGRKRTRTLGNG
ncbi:unnamed protein product [Trichogramma brassicae]|uniref:Uncharacterized protein n=1 Tax=Trichogramma brassicae TaxID=86971 RepID=A0A6H5IWI2_9HYME|nr:unnamed protein product [Trichogramma brassicae]